MSWFGMHAMERRPNRRTLEEVLSLGKKHPKVTRTGGGIGCVRGAEEKEAIIE